MPAFIQDLEVNQQKNGTFILFEAGPTHEGLESAKTLVKVAKEAGCDAIKFQMCDTERLQADPSIEFTYQYLERDGGTEKFVSITEPLVEVLKRRELSREEWIELKQFCDQQQVPMISTAMFPEEVDFLVDELKVSSIKVASSDINHISFIEYCAKKCASANVNLQIDTGNADLWEIERAMVAIENQGHTNTIIHLCPTGYPAHLESIHLRMIQTLRTMFPGYAIAFSDHSPGWDMDIAAVALGADMVEKTITMDRTTKSCEHSFSLEKKDAIQFVQSIRNVETALGSTRRIIPQDVREGRYKGRRSPYAKTALSAGTLITEKDFDFRRPEVGISSLDFQEMLGKPLAHDIQKSEVLKKDHV